MAVTDSASDVVDLATHPGVCRVADVLRRHGLPSDITVLPTDVRTARAAATALGVTPHQIVNSLIFRAHGPNGAASPLLILASGGHRVDVQHMLAITGLHDLEQATPDYVREVSGFVIGGVPPVGHQVVMPTVIDSSLNRHPTVWAAAGHPRAVFETTYDQLIYLTGARAVTVT